MSRKRYDLILANHTTMVKRLHKRGYLIQTCHGVFPELEQPSPYADAYVAISDEVAQHVASLGYNCEVIYNGIDCERFSPRNPINPTLRRVFSLCQGDEATEVVRSGCEELGLEFFKASKFDDNIFEIEECINRADLVVGIGRSLYDAMACGRAVVSLDSRTYSTTFDGHSCGGDGYLAPRDIEKSILNNCTGRSAMGHMIDRKRFVEELKLYNAADGAAHREFALEQLNIDLNIVRYINIYNSRAKGVKALLVAAMKRWRCWRHRHRR